MQRKITFIGVAILSVLILFTSCKKDSDKVKKNGSGTFYAFEAFINGKTISMPTDDEAIEIKININGSNADVDVIYYNNDEPENVPTIKCKLSTDADGFAVLKDESTGDVLVLYYDDSTIDFYLPQAQRISASKNGKKPGWWDEE